MRQKKTFLLSVLLLCSVWAFAGTSQKVTFLLKSGQRVSFLLSSHPKLYMWKDMFNDVIHVLENGSGWIKASFDYAEVQRVFFEDDDPSAGIKPIEGGVSAGHPVFDFSNGSLMARGLKADEKVSVYLISGILVKTFSADSLGLASISLQSLPKGVLIVRCQSGISYKLYNR